MNSLQLVATLVAVTLPFTVITAGDSGKSETANQKQEQGCESMGMKGMTGKMQMMSTDDEKAMRMCHMMTGMQMKDGQSGDHSHHK